LNCDIPSTLPAPRYGVALCALILALGAPAALAVDLLGAFRLALDYDARFQAARAANLAGQEPLSQATAQLLPNVSINGSRAKVSADMESGTQTGHNDYFSSNYVLQIRQPLYRRYNFAQYQQAKAQAMTADASLENDREAVVQRLSSAFFEALMSRDQLAFVLAQKEAYAAQLEASKQALASGTGTRTDIDDAQARYDLTLAQELEARQNVEFTRRRLEMLVNRPLDNLPFLDPARMALVPPDPARPEDWISRGEENNPELRSLRSGLEAARQEVEKARAGHHPTADLFAQRGKSQSESITAIDSRYSTSQVGVQFNIPIFAGGYVNSSIRQAKANLDKVEQEYEARRREVGLDIRKEFQNVTEGILKVRALEQAERSADQAVFSNKKGFQAGVRTRVDILNAEQQRMNTRRDLAQARYQYLLARVHLQSLANSSGEEAITAINPWLSDSPPARDTLSSRT